MATTEPSAPTPTISTPQATEQNSETPTTSPEPLYGEAKVKKEYLIAPRVHFSNKATGPTSTTPTDDAAASTITSATTEDGADAATKTGEETPSLAAPTKKKVRKDFMAEMRKLNICERISQGKFCPFGDSCKFSHDIATFVSLKGADIPTPCPFATDPILTSKCCPYGLKCRCPHPTTAAAITTTAPTAPNPTEATSTPTTAEGDQKPKEFWTHDGVEMNMLTKDLQGALRKHSVKYPHSDEVMKQIKLLEAAENSNADSSVTPPPPPPSQLCVDLGDKVSMKKKIDWHRKMYLPSLTTVGNLPFRRVCRSFGAEITCGEMALARNLLDGQSSEWALLRRHPSETIFGVQIASCRAGEVARCCELLETQGVSCDFVDFNAGCPIDQMTNLGCCAALLERPNRLGQCLVAASKTLKSLPLTLKIRLGRDEKEPTVHKNIIPRLQEWGVDAVVLHGRSRNQRYSKQSNWDYIGSCTKILAETCPDVTMMGNGDVFCPQDFETNLTNSGAATATIARAALIKPWVFTEIGKKGALWDISASERLDMLQDFSRFGLEHWGSDTQGVELTRRFMCEWLSYLWRYIPVGLLEVLPPRVADRPPAYRGRNDLETLFASDLASDWVKITEMFLGPAPATFQFVPKHKSNS